MQPDNAAAQSDAAGESTTRYFTVESANRALVFVRRVVQDIVAQYDELMKLRTQREDAAAAVGSERVEALRRRIEQATERLKELHDELSDVGCELKDWVAGLIDFPALHEGRRVWLCWKLGDAEVSHWHELYAGFAGRQPIGPDFGREAPAAPPKPPVKERSRK